MRKRIYRVRSRRVGDWWAIDVPDVPHIHTQAKRLDQVEGMARDAIALLLDVPRNSFDIAVDAVLPRPLQRKVDLVRRLRQQAEDTRRQAALESSYVVSDLATKGHLTVREIGRILGISHQRVGQLARKRVAS
jgi:predicted RNase H-like HicB family nuclease